MHTTRTPQPSQRHHHRKQNRLHHIHPIKRRRTRNTPQHTLNRPIDKPRQSILARPHTIREHHRTIEQLDSHPLPLRTLTGKHEHHTPSTIARDTPTHQTSHRTTLRQSPQTTQQPIATITHNHRTILKHRTLTQRKPNIPHTHTRLTPNPLTQPTSLPLKRPTTTTRNHPSNHTTTQHPNNPTNIPNHTVNILTIDTIDTVQAHPETPTTHTIPRRRLLQNQMRVGPTRTKRRHTSTTRLIPTLPHNALTQQRHLTRRPIDLPRRTIHMQSRRQHTITQSQNHLDHTTHTSSSLGMTNIRLQRPKPQRPNTTTRPTINRQQSLRLNRIAQPRTSPMTLNHTNLRPNQTSTQQSRTHNTLLRRTTRSSQTITSPILIHSTTTNNTQNLMPQPQRITQTLQHNNTNTLRDACAIRLVGVGLAATIRSQTTLAREHDEYARRGHHRDPAGERQ